MYYFLMDENKDEVSCIFCFTLLTFLIAFYWFICWVIIDITYFTALFILDIFKVILRLFEKVCNYFINNNVIRI